ncbi:hypothetical protein [Micromonospora haikouensis]
MLSAEMGRLLPSASRTRVDGSKLWQFSCRRPDPACGEPPPEDGKSAH